MNINLLDNEITKFLDNRDLFNYYRVDKLTYKRFYNDNLNNRIYKVIIKKIFTFDDDEEMDIQINGHATVKWTNYIQDLMQLIDQFGDYKQKILDIMQIHLYLPDLRKERITDYKKLTNYIVYCIDCNYRQQHTNNYYIKRFGRILREGLCFEKELIDIKNTAQGFKPHMKFIKGYVIDKVIDINYKTDNQIIKILQNISRLIQKIIVIKETLKCYYKDRVLKLQYYKWYSNIVDIIMLLQDYFNNIDLIMRFTYYIITGELTQTTMIDVLMKFNTIGVDLYDRQANVDFIISVIQNNEDTDIDYDEQVDDDELNNEINDNDEELYDNYVISLVEKCVMPPNSITLERTDFQFNDNRILDDYKYVIDKFLNQKNNNIIQNLLKRFKGELDHRFLDHKLILPNYFIKQIILYLQNKLIDKKWSNDDLKQLQEIIERLDDKDKLIDRYRIHRD